MKHSVSKRAFGLPKDQRNALVRGLAVSLILKERIVTTEPKAKEIRPFVERMVTHARKGTLTAQRLVTSKLGTGKHISFLMKTVAPRYKERAGGYTRIVKLPARKSDNAPMAVIEFVK